METKKVVTAELLEAVYGTKIKSFGTVGACNINDPLLNIGRYISITFEKMYFSDQYPDGTYMCTVSVYEFADQCKKWALGKKYEISSYTEIEGGWANIRTDEFIPTIFADSETEAILRACNYLLKTVPNILSEEEKQKLYALVE